MSEQNEKPEPQSAKPKVCKSRKELLVLAVSALVFAFVIYKMYLSKRGGPEPELAELNTDVAAEATDSPGTPAEKADLIALLDSADAETEQTSAPPIKLARDPFTMSKTMHDAVYKTIVKAVEQETSLEPVVLSEKNVQEVLAAIPGAQAAAAKGLHLDAVMNAGSWTGAAINGRILPLGGTILGFKLVEILDDSVVLQLDKHRVRLLIRPAGMPTGSD